MTESRSNNNKDGYSAYDSVYEENKVFKGQPDVKMLAFYLPQYPEGGVPSLVKLAQILSGASLI